MNGYVKITLVLFMLSFLIAPSLAINASSANFSVEDFIQSSSGGMANSTTYEVRHTQHYQQPVAGSDFTGNFSASLRWLPTSLATFITPLNVTYVVQACNIDNQTLQTDTIIQVGPVNTTLNILLTNCQYGCDPLIGACKDLVGTSKINFLLILSLLAVIIISYLIMRSLGKEHQMVKLFLYLFMITILATLNWLMGIANDYFTGSIVNAASTTSLNIAIGLQAISLFLIVYFILLFIGNVLTIRKEAIERRDNGEI